MDQWNTCVSTYVHMCVRVYICSYIPTYIRTYICMYVRRYVCMYVRTYIRRYVCMYVCMHIVGPHGLGRKNHRGQMLINFCERNGLIVTNTWFRKPKRRLHMQGTRSESTSVGLHTCETLIQKQCEECADNAWGRY